MTTAQRFWAKVAQAGNVCECWIWTACVNSYGYGQIRIAGRLVPAHRFSVELSGREIPPGKQIDHVCRERRCVNPWHLEVVTHAENVARGESGKHFKDKTHCPHGHGYTPENVMPVTTIVRGKKYPGRACRECRRIASRKRRGE